MAFVSINPATGECLESIPEWNVAEIDEALEEVAHAAPRWAGTDVATRSRLLLNAARVLRDERERWAWLITCEVGKLALEARAEIDKCAWGCEYYAEHAAQMLAPEIVASDAARSYVAFQPLGTVLAIMPWNFPFWQFFRTAAPVLAAGNTVVLKHASNVPRCAFAIEEIVRRAGFPNGVVRTLMAGSGQVARIIADPRIHAVTLTGSEAAGRQVAAAAASNLKKAVLELGGSDAFVVLEDADLEVTVPAAVQARFLNAGQSCIAAKRYIVMEAVADEFVARLLPLVQALRHGNPNDPLTTLAPLARGDLRDELHRQVTESVERGAYLLAGGAPVRDCGFFYLPTVLDHVRPGMPAWEEELFGPVACIIRVRDELEALHIANSSRYGLGASVWTQDVERGETFAQRFEAGACFVNGMVQSDPRLPFGGVKASGYGRELSHYGLREFVNAKTIWIAGKRGSSAHEQVASTE